MKLLYLVQAQRYDMCVWLAFTSTARSLGSCDEAKERVVYYYH